MTRTRPALVVFQGGASLVSPPERLVYEAHAAATLDLLSEAARSGAFERALLVTEEDSLATEALSAVAQLPALPLVVESGALQGHEGQFHFGQQLRRVCAGHDLKRVVYVGGGSLPLATAQTLADLALAVSGEAECVVANNLYSADVVAFNPTSALDKIDLPAADNDLAWLLHYRGGLPFAAMARTLASQFDLDTPSDLAALWWSAEVPPIKEQVGARLTGVLQRTPVELPALTERMERACGVMATRRAEVLVAGRVSSWVWRRLETNLPCQTRVVSEERGMRASGRDERGEARSLLGLYTDTTGIDGLLRALEQVCDAAFIDSRVLFAHRGVKPPVSDRFASDALMLEIISEPWVRELTQAAMSASIPVVLGGHSLVSGGVWALSERVRASSSAAKG